MKQNLVEKPFNKNLFLSIHKNNRHFTPHQLIETDQTIGLEVLLCSFSLKRKDSLTASFGPFSINIQPSLLSSSVYLWPKIRQNLKIYIQIKMKTRFFPLTVSPIYCRLQCNSGPELKKLSSDKNENKVAGARYLFERPYRCKIN